MSRIRRTRTVEVATVTADGDVNVILREPVASVDKTVDTVYIVTTAGHEYEYRLDKLLYVKVYDEERVERSGSRGRSDTAKDRAKGIPTPASTGGYD